MNTRLLLILLSLITFTIFSCSEDDDNIIDPALGIGEYLKAEVNNGVPYNWYYDQGNTGKYSDGNCGPTCTTMALKWDDKSWDRPVEYFRSSPTETGEWWNTLQIRDTLKHYGTECIKKNFNIESFKADIKYGFITILCIDNYYLRYNNSNFHYGRFYEVASEKSGHFIIVKGYKQTEEGLWFEVYDPLSRGEKYADGQFKGINRYYHEDYIKTATEKWWPNYIKITPH